MYISTTTSILLFTLTTLLSHTNAQAASTTQTQTFTSGSSPRPTSNPVTSYTSDTQFRDDMLYAHNFYRAAHNASDLAWNETLAKAATKWSDNCEFEHSRGPTGENLAMGYTNATANVDAWALERKDYKFGNNPTGFKSETGHFTQVVWRNTTSVGCGRKDCKGKNDVIGYLVVCEYWPVGNVAQADGGKQYYVDNVKEQIKGKNTDTVETGVTATSGVSSLRDRVWAVGVLGAAVIVGLGIMS